MVRIRGWIVAGWAALPWRWLQLSDKQASQREQVISAEGKQEDDDDTGKATCML